MSSRQLAVYKIEVLVFHKKNNNIHRSDSVKRDTKGIYICPQCHWEGYWEERCPKCENRRIVPKGKIKVVDTLPIAKHRTLMERFYNSKKAKRWGARYGTVINCEKVDISPYLENIEHLNLKQEPIAVELEQEDFVLNKALELERPRRRFDNGKFNVEIERNPIDRE